MDAAWFDKKYGDLMNQRVKVDPQPHSGKRVRVCMSYASR